MDWKHPSEAEKGTIIPSNWLYLHYYEALNVLFRVENALRILVYIVLKNDKRDKWIDLSLSSDEAAETTIGALAKKRIAQHQTFGYLGYPIESPMMHLTSGELVRIITSDAYWPLFKDFFLASRQVVTLKLQEIGDVRNALAHFRPLSIDDVEAVKQNAKQVLSSVEDALGAMIICSQRVPTNTTDNWYQELRTLGTDLCSFEFNQSSDGRWIRITLRFNARVVNHDTYDPQAYYMRYFVLNMDSPQILNRYNELRNLSVYLTESVPWIRMPKDYKPQFSKRLGFTFSRSTLSNESNKVRENLEKLLADIDNEAELVAKDNLAKGNLIHLIRILAKREENPERTWWSIDIKGLRCPVEKQHPTEYWGLIRIPDENLISNSEEFPWMPIAVSSGEIPF